MLDAADAALPLVAGWNPRLTALAIVAGAVLLGLLLHLLVFRVARVVARKTPTVLDDAFIAHCSRPLQLLLPLLLLALALGSLEPVVSAALLRAAREVLKVVLPVLVGWFFAGLVFVLEDVLLHHFNMASPDNLRARKVHTQIEILTRLAVVGIAIVTVAAILMSYERLRQLGAGLLASAGIAGVILGFAAQKTLGNLLAGIQIAITQPIRLDDVVVVEGEWGKIEEITLTYVVVRIWDLRRLVLPISYFIEKPFQNWTRTEAKILGTVLLYLDYRVPVEAVREKLGEIVHASELWDRDAWGLQVVDAGERTVTLRALMSAADAGTAWNLRCEVREELLAWLCESYPEALPRLRAEVEEVRGREASPACTGELQAEG